MLDTLSDGTEQQCCNAHDPFCKDSLDGDNETLPADDIAHGLIEDAKHQHALVVKIR